MRAATIEQSQRSLTVPLEHGNTLLNGSARSRHGAAIMAKIKEGLGERSINRPTSCTSSLPPRRALYCTINKSHERLFFFLIESFESVNTIDMKKAKSLARPRVRLSSRVTCQR